LRGGWCGKRAGEQRERVSAGGEYLRLIGCVDMRLVNLRVASAAGFIDRDDAKPRRAAHNYSRIFVPRIGDGGAWSGVALRHFEIKAR
jgi:hypothetical protein